MVVRAVVRVMAAVAGRTPRLSTLLFPPVLLLGLRLVLPVPGVADLERLVATHTSMELLLLPQVLAQREAVEAPHPRPAAVVPPHLALEQQSILVALVARSAVQLTAAQAAAVRPAKMEMALLAEGAVRREIHIPAVAAADLEEVLLAKTALPLLSAALAATTPLALAAA